MQEPGINSTPDEDLTQGSFRSGFRWFGVPVALKNPSPEVDNGSAQIWTCETTGAKSRKGAPWKVLESRLFIEFLQIWTCEIKRDTRDAPIQLQAQGRQYDRKVPEFKSRHRWQGQQSFPWIELHIYMKCMDVFPKTAWTSLYLDTLTYATLPSTKWSLRMKQKERRPHRAERQIRRPTHRHGLWLFDLLTRLVLGQLFLSLFR